jgi:hypothetical protein
MAAEELTPKLLELSKDLVVSSLGVESRTYRLRERRGPSAGVVSKAKTSHYSPSLSIVSARLRPIGCQVGCQCSRAHPFASEHRPRVSDRAGLRAVLA